nr:MAG TPA: hypothetical protein [Caudoviricetes sp.]
MLRLSLHHILYLINKRLRCLSFRTRLSPTLLCSTQDVSILLTISIVVEHILINDIRTS